MNCVRTRGEEPPRLYGVINGLLRMRNGLRRSQELDDLVDVLASSIGALTNPRTNCPHRRRSRRRSLAARDRRQLPEDRPRTRRGQTRRDEHGILTMSVYDFLLDPDSLTM